MTRPLAISIGIMAAVIGVSMFSLYDVTDRIRTFADEEEAEAVAFPEPEGPLYDASDVPREVRMFFPATNNDLLIRTQSLTIFESDELSNQARQIIDLLIAGPENTALVSGLPRGTELREIFISPDGTAYVDFSSALADNHPGGILPEQATVYAIVNSLTYNLDGIERVKILIGGNERETLAGHCLLLLPFEADLSITDIGNLEAIEGD